VSEIARLAQRMTVSNFVHNEATVTLDGKEIAVLRRTPGFIWATTNGTPWGGGRKIATALEAVANAYLTLVENGTQLPPVTTVHPYPTSAPLE